MDNIKIAKELVKVAKAILAADNDVLYIDLGFSASDDVAYQAIQSVFGQLSDGKWENSPRMEGYWKFAEVKKDAGRIVLEVQTKAYGSERSYNKKGLGLKYINNPYFQQSIEKIKNKIAGFLKAIVKDEYPNGWDRKNIAECSFLSNQTKVRVCDAYRVYDKLKDRNPKVYAK